MSEPTDHREVPFQQLDDLIADVIDRYANEGYGTLAIIEALQDVLAKRRTAYDRDPDPAEDEADVEEPANDWPGANAAGDGEKP